jgi:hypothetical protein
MIACFACREFRIHQVNTTYCNQSGDMRQSGVGIIRPETGETDNGTSNDSDRRADAIPREIEYKGIGKVSRAEGDKSDTVDVHGVLTSFKDATELPGVEGDIQKALDMLADGYNLWAREQALIPTNSEPCSMQLIGRQSQRMRKQRTRKRTMGALLSPLISSKVNSSVVLAQSRHSLEWTFPK